MERELQLMLTDMAERVHVERARRWPTLRKARRRRRLVAATSLLGLVAVIVIGMGITDSWRSGPRPAPADRSEKGRSLPDEPETNVLITEGKGGAWALYGGVGDDGQILCLSLRGVVCTRATPPTGSVVFTTFESVPSGEGFVFGVVGPDTAQLQLLVSGRLIDLELGQFPNELGLEQMRFFVRPVRGEGMGEIIARDAEGNVLQRTDVGWGNSK